MTDAAFADALGGYCAQEPFRPFILVFNTDERLTVTHPEAVRITVLEPEESDDLAESAGVPVQVVVYRGPNGKYRLFDATSVNQLMDVPDA